MEVNYKKEPQLIFMQALGRTARTSRCRILRLLVGLQEGIHIFYFIFVELDLKYNIE